MQNQVNELLAGQYVVFLNRETVLCFIHKRGR